MATPPPAPATPSRAAESARVASGGGAPPGVIERVDFHLHSYYSACGKRDMIPAAVAAAYRDAGYAAVGFTDHLHPWIDPAIFDRLRAELATARNGHAGLLCFVGCEAELVAPGAATLTPGVAERLDFALMSASHFQLAHVAKPGDPSPAGVAAHYLRFFCEAVRWPGVTAIAHPFHTNHDPFGPIADIWRHVDRHQLRDALSEAAARGVAMELSPKALAPAYFDTLLEFYRLAYECGTRFTVGSDAHGRAGVGTTGRLRPLAEAIGVQDERIWQPATTPRAVS